jgi:general secretion pathway protein C
MDFRTLFFGVRLFLLTALSYFCALSINKVIAFWLTPSPSALLQDEGDLPLPSTQQKLPLSSYAVIYNRDIFNSVKAPSQKEGIAVASSSGTLKLWGTAVRDRDQAFAILEDQHSRTQGLYREGQTIVPGVTLVKVDWDHVIIDRDGRRETLILPTDTSSPPTQLVKGLPPQPSDAPQGINQVAPDTFQVDRQEVDQAVANLNEIFTQVRAVPYSTPDGTTQGFRLFSIKAESLIDRLGLKNGDIVQRVNGVEVSDPSTAFNLLQDLQGLSHIRVDVLRNHQPVTLSYEIQ